MQGKAMISIGIKPNKHCMEKTIPINNVYVAGEKGKKVKHDLKSRSHKRLINLTTEKCQKLLPGKINKSHQRESLCEYYY